MVRRWLGILFGTCLGVGFVPVIPATWTSLFVALVVALTQPSLRIQLLALTVVLVLGVPACSALEERYGKDPKQATIDEVAGMLLTLLAVPLTWLNVLVGFFLFRALDVFKLPPARQAERLAAGLGVMADDVVAGIQARLLMAVIVWVVARVG